MNFRNEIEKLKDRVDLLESDKRIVNLTRFKPIEKELEEQHRDYVYRSAIEHWGEIPQIMVCLEEMSELQKELLKSVRFSDRSPETIIKITSEIADVLNMVESLKLIFGISTKDIDNIMTEKMKKVEMTIKKQQEEQI